MVQIRTCETFVAALLVYLRCTPNWNLGKSAGDCDMICMGFIWIAYINQKQSIFQHFTHWSALFRSQTSYFLLLIIINLSNQNSSYKIQSKHMDL